MKKLVIQDNGCGIRKDDLDIVCERFTTSKLQTFDDLSNISTYGFRGEALASISHVSHLTITTRTSESKCAFRVAYGDGKPKDKPKPCSGNQGTQLVIEDLFYNISTRRKALNMPSQEYTKIIDVVSKYSVHNPRIGFTLKKLGDPSNDIHTLSNSTNIDNIRDIYGPAVAKELLQFECADKILGFKSRGFITNANYSVKKFSLLLFINERLVKNASLQKAIDSIYSAYLPKCSHPFVYISLGINSKNVDVNVHPTKHEVHFLYEEAIVEKIGHAIDGLLINSNSSRTFLNQSLLPFPVCSKDRNQGSQQPTKVYDNQLVRTDSKDQKLDAFLCPKPIGSEEIPTNHMLDVEPRSEVSLTSIQNLREEVKSLCHKGLLEIFQEHSFVGCVNSENALIQHQTRLYMVNTCKLSEELFYQLMLKRFGSHGIIRLSKPAPLFELAVIALGSEGAECNEFQGNKEDLAKEVVNILVENSEMVLAYFSIEIDQDGNLRSLPLLLEGYIPCLRKLPMCILRLATEVQWTEEETCFRTFCKELANLYSFPLDSEDKEYQNGSSWKWTVEHILYPAFKRSLQPPKAFAEDISVLQIANLPDLYKVFERC